jgi:hypothetical protein
MEKKELDFENNDSLIKVRILIVFFMKNRESWSVSNFGFNDFEAKLIQI